MDLFTLENLMTLMVLTLLQAVLGFDNLLYISIESKRVPEDKQAYVRRVGITLAIVLRIGLLFGVMAAIQLFQTPFFTIHLGGVIDAEFNVHSFIVLMGGAFIIYTAIKEIFHLLMVDELAATENTSKHSIAKSLFWIVVMNLVFSFDSILSAMALTDVFAVMATAIVISGAMMVLLADHVSEFLKKNRMYEVLGLFILFIVGIMLVSEGGHLAHIHLLGYPVEPMAKTTFYFILFVLVAVDMVQSRYRKKLVSQSVVERR